MVKSAKSRNASPRLQKDLLAGLEHLRFETREISRMYVANLQRDMVQLIDFINEAGRARTNGRSATFARMKEALDEISIKPEKGRRKDLRRIEQALRSMMKLAFNKNADV